MNFGHFQVFLGINQDGSLLRMKERESKKKSFLFFQARQQASKLFHHQISKSWSCQFSPFRFSPAGRLGRFLCSCCSYCIARALRSFKVVRHENLGRVWADPEEQHAGKMKNGPAINSFPFLMLRSDAVCQKTGMRKNVWILSLFFGLNCVQRIPGCHGKIPQSMIGTQNFLVRVARRVKFGGSNHKQ